MDWRDYFHHPDLSLPVLRRRAADDLLDLLDSFGALVATGGRSLTWGNSFPSRTAYDSAAWRLRKQGLIAHRRHGTGKPCLTLTEDGAEHVSVALRPERRWQKRWNGRWYVLVYDVPECDRAYRDSLRKFLYRMRAGCLQRSVWVTTFDIRPEYNDLVHAAEVQTVSFLFEATTVLGRDPDEVVRAAWDWGRIDRIHEWYLKVFRQNLRHIESRTLNANELQTRAREEISAYLSAMEEDPLLPETLLPADYQGMLVHSVHREFVECVAHRLRDG